MKQYIALIKAVYSAGDDVVAQVIADQVRINGGKDLIPEEGDSIDVAEVVAYGLYSSEHETLDLLRLSRNALIRLRVSPALDLAREIDKACWIIKRKTEDMWDAGSYDYGKFMSIVDTVLKGGSTDALDA